jgi:hypothetical protein
MTPNTIGGINRLSSFDKREIYTRLIPPILLQRFHLNPYLVDASGHDLLRLHCPSGSMVAEMELRHQYDFPDPIFYGEITDTINGQIHVLLYILNDPESPRFDVDRLPDGKTTGFGTIQRNYSAEVSAMRFGLAPGQIRSGLRILGTAIQAFERFVESLDHEMYFVEPLYYHNAIIFERYGFSYEKGRRLMERIQAGFLHGGDLSARLDGSTPFRSSTAAKSIRLRSWAIHDGLLGEPFTNVTMYKRIGKSAGLKTSDNCGW